MKCKIQEILFIVKKLTVFKICTPVKKRTTLLHKYMDQYLSQMEHVLIKIDCQGAEIPILQGAGNILKKTDFIFIRNAIIWSIQ